VVIHMVYLWLLTS